MIALRHLEEREKELQELADQEAFKSLCCSLILRSLRDLVTYRNATKRQHKRIHDEAYIWIYGDVQEPDLSEDQIDVENNHVSQDEAKKLLIKFEHSMSFEEVCATIGWDPGYVRKEARTLTEKDLLRLKQLHGWE